MDNDSLFRTLPSKMVNAVTRRTTGVQLHDYGCMLRAYRRDVVEAMLMCKEHSSFIPALANSFAKRIAEVPVGHAERAAGDSKYGLWKLINLQFDLLTSFSLLPLQMLSVVGVVVSFLGMGFGLYLMIYRILHPEGSVQGVFTLFAVLFIFVGAQFLAFGLLGEYIGRIYQEVRDRPRYVVKKIHRSE
jgi:undecaprenyl-phosphate 4-deoxy-4-formamido-L-arabinose transferase